MSGKLLQVHYVLAIELRKKIERRKRGTEI
jgi:hypothetical protein